MKSKIIIFLTTLLMFSTCANANLINKTIKNSQVENQATLSVLVKDKENSKILYKRHNTKLLNPASTLKTLTFGASYVCLGSDYKFKTSAYRDKKNLYIKLGGDVLLSYFDLKTLISQIKQKTDFSKLENIYIDDTLFENNVYPLSWMQEDIWPYQRAISPYIIDDNLVKIMINRSSLATKVDIMQNDIYKMSIINDLQLGDKQDIKIIQDFGANSPLITFKGTVMKDDFKMVPVLNPQINFVVKLNEAIKDNDIVYYNKIQFKKVPSDAVEIAYVAHNIKEVSNYILKKSDNFASEVVFRVAGAKYINYSKTATLNDSIELFNNIYKDFLNENIKIFDGSGVSRHNILDVDFLVNSLAYISNQTDILSLMPTSDEGTLKDRLLFLKDNLKAKTGTLSEMSALVGAMKTKNQKDVIFAIIIQNSPKRRAFLKNLEDEIVFDIYKKY